MIRFVIPPLAVLCAASPLAHAGSDKDLSGAGYITRQDVSTRLTTQGYTVSKVESDDGAYEAKVMKGGQKMKLTVDPKSGAITASKNDD